MVKIFPIGDYALTVTRAPDGRGYTVGAIAHTPRVWEPIPESYPIRTFTNVGAVQDFINARRDWERRYNQWA